MSRAELTRWHRAWTASRVVAFCTFALVSMAGVGVSFGSEAAPLESPRPLPEKVTFNAHIRPIMSNTCFTCHGPDEEDNESEFMLDSFENATSPLPSDEDLVGIAPGHPMKSEVYLRIVGESDSGEQMPPSDFRHSLTSRDKALFRRWIEQGAKYEQHWSYAPIARPDVPKPADPTGWIANPIDAFVLARLQQEQLQPTEPANRATLLRRVTLDLIGLPPTPEELEDFLADRSDQAYQQVVERLLASPHFGERMASFWLDLVRFADTVGFHGDQNQRIFPYRDYVINAFNDNMPFDRFTREQLAGDLLAEPTDDQLVATGFLRLNMMTREGGAQPGEYLAKYRADRVRALGTAWLGSTLACCECHNHKYDPFTTHDFYSLGAFFDDLQQWGVYADYGYTPNADLKGFNNDYPFPPEIRVDSKSLRAQIAKEERLRDGQIFRELGSATLASRKFEQWVAGLKPQLQSWPDGWIPLNVAQVTNSGDTQGQRLDDGTLLFTGPPQPKEMITIDARVPAAVLVNSIRVEVLPDARNGGSVGRLDDGRFTITSLTAVMNDDSGSPPKKAEPSKLVPIPIAWSQADRRDPYAYSSGHEPTALDKGWRSGPIRWQLPSNEAQLPHTAVYHFDRPVELTPDIELQLDIASGDVGRLRLSVTPVGHAIAGWDAVDDRLRQAALAADDQRTAEHDIALVAAYHRSSLPISQQSPTSRQSRDRILELRCGKAMSLVAQSLPAEKLPMTRVLPRGNWQDDTGPLAPPSFPAFLSESDTESSVNEPPLRLTRLDLANWLTSPDNPLTPRHFVNRIWKQFFGTGLSAKLDDLGNQGEWPSHPQLVDWLAGEFVDSGWDVKQVVRLIVTSKTYRQAAAMRSDLVEADPYNRLLAQQSPRRIEAEIVRDNALSIAGLLVTDCIGGPSDFPYQPAGHYRNLQFPNRRYRHSDDWRQYRRGVYMHWQRTFLHPMLVNFDAPSRDECTADRPPSNSPQQALTLLNDPTFIEAASGLAVHLLSEGAGSDIHQFFEQAYLRALARKPSEQECTGLEKLFAEQVAHYRSNPEDAEKLLKAGTAGNVGSIEPAQLAAYAQVCRVILNLHETITRY